MKCLRFKVRIFQILIKLFQVKDDLWVPSVISLKKMGEIYSTVFTLYNNTFLPPLE